MHDADPGWSPRTQLSRRSVVAGGVAAMAASGLTGPARALYKKAHLL